MVAVRHETQAKEYERHPDQQDTDAGGCGHRSLAASKNVITFLY